MSMTWKELNAYGASFLKEFSVVDYEFDAFQLLLHTSGFSSAEYFLRMNDEVHGNAKIRYEAFLKRRSNLEPLQYIIGKWDFYKSEFFVGDGVLIPRPETEELVSHAVKIIREKKHKRVIDLCSGSGCIGISIAKECPEAEVILVELYDKAYSYSEKNIAFHGLKNVRLVRHDVFCNPESIFSDVDFIVSNPPYIPSCEIASLQKEVLREPVTALDGGNDGLDFYREIYDSWEKIMSSDGAFAFECGENQSEDIVMIFKELFDCEIKSDIYGVDRFVVGFRRQEA